MARKRYASAVGWVLLWALFQSVAVSLAVAWAPERAAQVVHSGPKYSEEMLNWVRTGEGAEGSPRLFLPIHLRHYAGLCVLSVVTAGSAALVLGTWLLNYMSYYVADLVRASADPVTATLLGWPVWSVIRVAGFVVTGAALTGFSLSLYNRLRKRTRAVKFPARVFFDRSCFGRARRGDQGRACPLLAARAAPSARGVAAPRRTHPRGRL